MSEADVCVVGGGLAGKVAALAAARADGGASVTLVTEPGPDLRDTGGLVDVLGYTPGGRGPLVNPFWALDDLPETHPYAVVGEGMLRDGLALFDDVVGDSYGGGDTDRNALVPTAFGRLRPTGRYPRSVEAGLASERRETMLLGFKRLPSFDGPPAADRLEAVVPYRVDGFNVDFPSETEDRVEMAEFLDENPVASTGNPARESLAASARIYQSSEKRIGFPAVLGLERHREIRRQFEDALDVRVFEVPAGSPSVPGMRLDSQFDAALASAGVSVEREATVTGAETGDGHVDSVRLSSGETVTASQFVLATGGLAEGGLASTRTTVTEPLFDCHVDAPDDRGEWAERDPFGDHAFARFGVSVDDGLRPLGADDVSAFGNLRAAGRVLGGFDYAAENSGGGVAVATGYAAGLRAAETV